MKGPSEEELLQREGDDICLERGGRSRRREEEGQRWEDRLQENWENCLVSQETSFVCNGQLILDRGKLETREGEEGKERKRMAVMAQKHNPKVVR